MSYFTSEEEHKRRARIFANSKNDREAAEKVGMSVAAFSKWRRGAGIPHHKIVRKETKPNRPRQDPTPFYRPSPDAHIYKRMLRERFMPTQDSAIGIPGVNVRTRIRYVDRAI